MSSGDGAELVRRLRLLVEEARGQGMKQSALSKHRHVPSPAAVSELLNGKRKTLAEWETVWGIVTVCADHARKNGYSLRQPVDDLTWRTRYRDAESPTSLPSHPIPEPPLDAPLPWPVLDWDPYDLGVHRSITVTDLCVDRLPELTPYLLRPHDKKLRKQLTDTVRNRVIMLVGESSTGKTRAMFEAVRECLGDWSLVHPLDVSELLALAAPGALPPRCVVWLNEAQRYLDDARTVTALRRILRGPGPVVLLGSLWPGEWDRFVVHPKVGIRDAHRPARELLGLARRVLVPLALTESELKELDTPELRDPRWSTARQTSGGRHQVIQVLAGGVHLAQRYDHSADPYGRALVSVAMDVCRVGWRGPIPLALLREAAPGCLTAEERVVHDDQWWSTGLGHATSLYNGVSALTLVRTDEGMGEPDSVELHDYLVQHGQVTRKTLPVPAATWEALIAHANRPDDRARMAENAYHRGLWRISAQLAIVSARAGDLRAVYRVRERLFSARWEEAEKWYQFALKSGDADLVWGRIEELDREDDVTEELNTRLEQLTESGDAHAMWRLAWLHRLEMNDEVALSWLRRAVAAGHDEAFCTLAAAGFETEAEKLLAEAANAGHGRSMYQLALLLERRGRQDLADHWWQRVARCPSGSLRLVFDRDRERGPRLWNEAADEGNINAVRHLADHYRTFDGTPERAIPLLRRLVAHGDREAMEQLAEAFEQCGEVAEAERLWIFMVEENVYRSHAVYRLSTFLAKHAPVRGERIVRRLAEGGDEEAMWCYSLYFVDRDNPTQRDEWVRRAAEHGHGLALNTVGRRLVETATAENFEKWARHTVLAHAGHSGNVFAVFHELADLLERVGRSEEAERMRTHGLEPDGSAGRPWDISVLFLE
jgi:TPR repeat protein